MAYSSPLAHTSAGSANATTATTSGIDTSGADFLAVLAGWFAGTAAVSDSKSNTWTALTQVGGGGSYGGQIFYCRPTSVGSGHTFTVTASFPCVAVLAFSGSVASPFDQQSGTAGSATPGSITPAEDNELFILGFGGSGTGTTATPGSGFTFSDGVDSGGNNAACAMAYLIQTAAAAKNPTWTGGANHRSAMATFKAAAAAAGHPAARRLGLAAYCRPAEIGREGVGVM